jgi:ectoine hydroxylase-related dioxygenase (phytanoyl-CoA dioxygenase family)
MIHPHSTTTPPAPTPTPVWLDPADCRIDELEALLDAGALTAAPPLSAGLARGVPLYDCAALRPRLAEPDFARRLMSEWHGVFASGAGIIVLQGAWTPDEAVDRVSTACFAMIEAEKAGGHGGDHFATAGANDRVWNALQKLALRDPEAFCRYYANPFLALVATAWLGPGYQITSQVNCVNPGGAAQQPHRDYHLGFCTPTQAAAYPRSVHLLSPHLTLQGTVAHGDMPLDSGPTLLLPHSQKYPAGYLLAGREDFRQCFRARHVQLPLRQGDAVFFNPALLHAAGANRTATTRRLGNLLQISSAFGRAMEAVDRPAMCLALYPALGDALASGALDARQARAVVAACAEGYAFPTNLDLDPPLGGLAPPSQQDLLHRALAERWPVEQLAAQLQQRSAQQRP